MFIRRAHAHHHNDDSIRMWMESLVGGHPSTHKRLRDLRLTLVPSHAACLSAREGGMGVHSTAQLRSFSCSFFVRKSTE